MTPTWADMVVDTLKEIKEDIRLLRLELREDKNKCYRRFATKKELRVGLLFLSAGLVAGLLLVAYYPLQTASVVGGVLRVIK